MYKSNLIKFNTTIEKKIQKAVAERRAAVERKRARVNEAWHALELADNESKRSTNSKKRARSASQASTSNIEVCLLLFSFDAS